MKPPATVDVSQLFSASARYKAPVFQRFYMWGETELTQLIEDIELADPSIGQFLGAIVLKDMGSESGPASPTVYLLIDGQQRLTTLYILLLAMASVAAKFKKKDNVEFIWNNYLVEKSSSAYLGWPKLVPTLQDRHTFYDILESALPKAAWNFTSDPPDKKPRTSKTLENQWKRMQNHVAESVISSNGKFDRVAFDRMLGAIKKSLRVINITLESNDDANAIFSRLNSRGVPLELSDLVRNEVFSKFGPGEGAKADKWFHKEWQPFEKTIPSDDLSAFFPVYAYIILKGKVTKSAAFVALQGKWKKESPAAILADLKRYSPFFSSLSLFKPIDTLPSVMNGQMERFSRMPRSRVTWPFIIETLRAVQNSKLSKQDASRSLHMVESFLVRRALTGKEPTGLHAVFKVLWEKTRGAPDEVRDNITTATIHSPSDKELTEFLAKQRSDTRVILGFILEEHERDFTRANKFDPAPQHAATIEHILPQNLGGDWKQDFTAVQHDACVGLLGNLVSLTEKQNKSVQDDPWAEKRKRYKGSNFKSTADLHDKPVWTEAQIRERTTALTKWIISRWPDLSSI